MSFSPVSTHLPVSICDSPQEAIDRGFVYRTPEYLPIQITGAVVVRNGTQSGKATVDLVLVDEKGQKYSAMITASLWGIVTQVAQP